MKYEWRKKDKGIYLPKAIPTLIHLPTMQYLTIEGEGNPNSQGFNLCVQALYAMSYGIKMMPKVGTPPNDYYEYTVFPLEGEWNLTKEGIGKYQAGYAIVDLKDDFKYKVMIRQPNFANEELVESIREKVEVKKKDLPIDQVVFESLTEGQAIQMLHVGPYDNEPATFAKMEAYAEGQGLKRIDKRHKEIYVSDPRKVAPEKLKTTLRFWVEG